MANEIIIDDFTILESYVYDNKLYLLGDGGMMKVYDSNYQLVASHNLYIDGIIRKIYFKEDYT